MPDYLERARQLYASSCVIDMHADTPQRFADEDWDFTSSDLGRGHISLPTARSGGMDAEFFAAWVEPHEWQGRYAARTHQLIDAVHEQVAKSQGQLALCTRADEILTAKQEGQFATLIGIEGGHSIEARLDLLETFYAKGTRYMTLTWSNTNEWADSSNDEEVHNGLTAFGKDVVRTMNRLGMMVDISHVSDKTFWQVLATSQAPVIASHSSCRELTGAPRNLTDDMMRQLADLGGVVCINFFPAFIDEGWRAQWNALRPPRVERHNAVAAPYRLDNKPVPFAVSDNVDREFADAFPRAPLASLIAHFEHALDVVGPDHVGIGTDFDGICSTPAQIDSAEDLPRITAELLERGHNEEDLRKVLGGNILRVFHAVEDHAKGVS